MTATPESTESIGSYLRGVRERRALTREEVAQTTRIPLRTLQSIEEDRHDGLPGDVFVKGFVKAYAKALGLDEAEVLMRFEQGNRPSRVSETTLPTMETSDRGRRFGLAMAVVILLILFSLAIAVVIRPRHRETPVELSARRAPVTGLA